MTEAERKQLMLIWRRAGIVRNTLVDFHKRLARQPAQKQEMQAVIDEQDQVVTSLADLLKAESEAPVLPADKKGEGS